MAIRHRRGSYKDFNPDKMLPGELAMTTDGTRKVFAAFASGDVKELDSVEDVEESTALGIAAIEEKLEEALLAIGSGVDASLSIDGKAADAAATGRELKKLSDNYVTIEQTIDGFTIRDQERKVLIDGASIRTDGMILSRLFSKNDTTSYAEMRDNGLNIILGQAEVFGIGYYSDKVPLPYMIFGAGSTTDIQDAGMIKKYANGIWIGDSADRYVGEITNGTGLFIDTSTQTIYKYIKGVGVALADTSNVTAVFG